MWARLPDYLGARPRSTTENRTLLLEELRADPRRRLAFLGSGLRDADPLVRTDAGEWAGIVCLDGHLELAARAALGWLGEGELPDGERTLRAALGLQAGPVGLCEGQERCGEEHPGFWELRESAPALLDELLGAVPARTRLQIAEWMAHEAPERPPELIEALLDWLGGEAAGPRETAVAVVGAFLLACPEPILPFLTRFAGHAHPRTREAAAGLLRGRGVLRDPALASGEDIERLILGGDKRLWPALVRVMFSHIDEPQLELERIFHTERRPGSGHRLLDCLKEWRSRPEPALREFAAFVPGQTP
jgi:hypothetical protein